MEGLWPILVLWVLAMLLGGKKKKPQQQPPGEMGGASQQGGTLRGDFARALEELKRAEAEARTRAQAEVRQQAIALPKPRPAKKPPKRPAPVEAFDDRAIEVVSLEGGAYDVEAEALIEARRQAADRGERTSVSSEQLSAAQIRRRAPRVDAAIGGAAQHAAWHERLEATAPVPKVKALPAGRERLTRFADGTLRGAVILSEILGPARGSRR